MRFTDRQLEDLTRQVIESGTSPEEWLNKLDAVVTSDPFPTVKALKELLKEGYEINTPQESLDTLRDFIDTIDQFNTDAEKVLNLKSDSFKNGKKRSHKLDELLERSETIDLELPYFESLRAYKAKLNEYDGRLTADVLTSGDTALQISLYNEGMQLRADSPEFAQLRNIIESSSWEDQVQQALSTTYNAKNIRKLVKDAEDMGMSSESGTLFHRLIRVEEFGRAVQQRIDNICKGREKLDLDREDDVLNLGRNEENESYSIILDPQSISRVQNHLWRSKKTIEEIEEILVHQSKKPTVMERALITEAHRLMSLCRELSFKSELIPELSNELARMGTWSEHVRATFMNGRQKSLETVLKETLSNVQRITGSDGKPGLWCVCRKAESGLMIECDNCCEWYHSSCLKISRNVVRSSNSYVCPICNPSEESKKITHLSRQPKLEEISNLITQSETLKFRPKDYSVILGIYATMQGYRNRVQAFCRSRTQLGIEDLPKIKHYLRTLMGLEVLLQDETEFLTAKVKSLTHVPRPQNSSSSHSENKSTTPSTNKHVAINKKIESERPLNTNIPPLSISYHHQESPTQTVTCICGKTHKKTGVVGCSSCQRLFHSDCVYESKGTSSTPLKCSQCISPSPSKLYIYI